MENIFMQTSLINLWDNKYAKTLGPEQLLKYRSNLLGSDLSITNFGGGNTSSKIDAQDPLTQEKVPVLWVKGSGGDLGSIKIDGFSTLYLEKLINLKKLYRGLEYEDKMLEYLSHCNFNVNTRVASIDTFLHAFIPYKEVDHMHPDSIIAIACTKNSKKLTQQIFQGKLAWLPWQRPGFDLGLKIGQVASQDKEVKGVVLEGHGLFTWENSSERCYDNTISMIRKANDWLKENSNCTYFGGACFSELKKEKRESIAATLMPLIRGKTKGDQFKVAHFNDSQEVLQFVNSNQLSKLAALGTSCPDHFLRTKIYPLVVNFNPNIENLNEEMNLCINQIHSQIDNYRQQYASYYNNYKRENSPSIRDANPVVYLVPGVGMMTFSKDKATARISSEFYTNAINVIREASAVDSYKKLDEKEAFDIEYWTLEENKLLRMPKPKKLSARIAFITGGAGGIGCAIATRFLEDDASVVLADIDQISLDIVKEKLIKKFDKDRVRTILCDVTNEKEVIKAMEYTSTQYGGLDILVCNAGIASSASLEDTTLELWSKNFDILSTGYFLTAREGFKILKRQNTGGSIVFISSKNGLVASPKASAYCSAKASEIQLSRTIAIEGAPLGIRCNVVNPDAVFKGSKIWDSKWRKERANAYNICDESLEEYYSKRSLLKRNVFPEDVAEAVYFWATESSSKSTGNIINVDAGNSSAFTR
jgi:rhamnulose-1-phosphate aldolase/alcohol dehydrogenase